MSVKWIGGFISSGVVLCALIVGGCSTEAKRVDCEGKLLPVNKPAASTPTKASASRDETGAHEN